ncbi:hypothetical protein MNV49_002965 [Pseudohyphozyma bogoriensis]|nr:hypothetical protein MNV49_002965 [Pseudohyphozyma bogoriensis]
MVIGGEMTGDGTVKGTEETDGSAGTDDRRIAESPGPTIRAGGTVRLSSRDPKVARTVDIPPPSESYLAATLVPSTRLSTATSKPPLLILDLNHTLVHRPSASSSSNPIPRPFLATFLRYILLSDAKWTVAVYSSAQSKNVLRMISSIGLVDTQRADAYPRGKAWETKEGDLLALVWARENLGLSAREFGRNVETVKDLAEVWEKTNCGEWGVERTVLLDDEMFKAQIQPHNHLPITSFYPTNALPRVVPLAPHRARSTSPSPLTPSTPPTVPAPNTSGDDDSALLSTIYFLHHIRDESNVAAFIRDGGVDKLREQAGGEDGAVQEGKRICEELGVRVVREWDAKWTKW